MPEAKDGANILNDSIPAVETPAAAAPAKKWVLKDGSFEKEVTSESELVALAQKNVHVDRVMREQAERGKQLEAQARDHDQAIKIAEAVRKSATGDRDAIRYLAKVQRPDLSDEQLDQVMGAMYDDHAAKDAPRDAIRNAAPKALTLSDLPPEVQQTVQGVRASQQEEARNKVRKDIADNVAKDEILGYITTRDKSGKLRDFALKAVERSIKDQILDAAGRFDESMVTNAVLEARKDIKTLLETGATFGGNNASAVNLGPAPNSSMFDSVATPPKPPTRPKNFGDNASRTDYIMALAQKARAEFEEAAS